MRTRPQDRTRVLVRADQLLVVEEQWAIANGTHDHFLAVQKRRQFVVSQLRTRFGHEPSANDVDWAILNEDCLTFAEEMDWGLYRNARFSMSEILAKENKFSQSLDLLLEVCYIDLNGPNNCSGIKDHDLLREFPPFNPKTGDLAPGVIGRIQDMMHVLELSIGQIESRFADVGGCLEKSLPLPMPPNKAWRKLQRALK